MRTVTITQGEPDEDGEIVARFVQQADGRWLDDDHTEEEPYDTQALLGELAAVLL